MGPARVTGLGTSHILPTPLGQKPMVGTGDKFCSVLKRDLVRRLYRAPMRNDSRLYVAPVPADAPGAVDLIAGSNLRKRARAAIAHENRGAAPGAITTTMLASSIRIDRLREIEVRRIVARDDRLRALDRDGCLRPGRRLLRRLEPAVVRALALFLLETPFRIGGRATTLVHFAARSRRGL